MVYAGIRDAEGALCIPDGSCRCLGLTESFVLPPCRSFRLEDGTGPQLYAADVVYAVTALLEAPPAVRLGDAAQPDDKADHFWCGALPHSQFSKCTYCPMCWYTCKGSRTSESPAEVI